MTSKESAARDKELYFLRTAAHPSMPDSNRFSDLYVRHYGNGIDSIVLTPAPPKFLRFHLDPSGQQLATSWKHAGLVFGLVLGLGADKPLGGWEEAQLVENEGETGYVWTKTSDGREVLEWEGGDEESNSWAGWMATEWKHGYPQLFWITRSLQKELPAFCEKVILVKEPIFGQPETEHT